MDETHRERAASRGIALLCVSLIGVGCATRIDVDFDENEPFDQYQTWSWHLEAESAPPEADRAAVMLDGRVRRLIGQAIESRGYERVEVDPDLLLTYESSLRQHLVTANVPRAPYLLSSHHSSASYWIEGTDETVELHEDFSLLVEAFEPEGRRVWKGRFELAVERPATINVGEAVTALLERFPSRGPTPSLDAAP
jgi:hypothetical protein